MAGIRELINDCLDVTAEQTAANVMEKVACPPKWRELFWPLLVAEAATELRNATRAVESAIPISGKPSTDPAGERASYLGERFAVGDGRFVSWGEATVADHAERISMLSKLVGGLGRTIARHEWAIETITAAAADCLNDVAEVAA